MTFLQEAFNMPTGYLQTVYGLYSPYPEAAVDILTDYPYVARWFNSTKPLSRFNVFTGLNSL